MPPYAFGGLGLRKDGDVVMSAIDKAVHTAYKLCRRYHMPPNEAAMCGAWLYQSEWVLTAADDVSKLVLLGYGVVPVMYKSGLDAAHRNRKAIKHSLMRRLEGQTWK